MNILDDEDRIRQIFKYGKFVLLLIPALIIFFSIRGCTNSYGDIEKIMISEAKNYVNDNNITVSSETYIEIANFGMIQGTEFCNSGSGVIVSNENGSLKYQPFLKCDDYSTKIVNNKSNYITLNGDEVTILNVGEIFVDPYYTIKGELINGYVDISGVVGTTPGIYNIYYDVYYPTDEGDSEEVENFEKIETLIRKVIVVRSNKNSTISGLENTEEPYLKLLGDTNMKVAKGTKFVDPSYVAYDYVDGKISRKVKTSGKVDTNVVGQYKIDYMVTNSRGKTQFATRYVEVVAQTANLDIKVTKESSGNKVTVNIEVIGDGYSELKMNGEKTSSRRYSFVATDNRTYSLQLTDIYGNVHYKEVEIDDIDNIKPTGTCKAVTMYNKTTVSVEATDNKGIAGFNYKVNKKESGFISEVAYEADEKGTEVSVIIKDVSGNTTDVPCTIEEGSKLYVNEKGYNCLYPFTCFKQGDYTNWRYEFCSTDTCGTINRRGCSLTSVTTLVSGFGVKDKNGELYTPYTMLSEVYDTVACKHRQYCSGPTSAYRAFTHLGLDVIRNESGGVSYSFSRDKIPIILEHLKKGGAVLIRAAGPGMYAAKKGHILALLGVNEKDEVYLFDPNAKFGETNGKGPVNTFISTEYLVKGRITWFQLVTK